MIFSDDEDNDKRPQIEFITSISKEDQKEDQKEARKMTNIKERYKFICFESLLIICVVNRLKLKLK